MERKREIVKIGGPGLPGATAGRWIRAGTTTGKAGHSRVEQQRRCGIVVWRRQMQLFRAGQDPVERGDHALLFGLAVFQAGKLHGLSNHSRRDA